MEYINLQIAPDKVMILAYKYEYPTFIFENDIEIKGWIIGKIIKIGGPRFSTYKYDFKRYLEFVITDPNGVQKVKKWFCHNGDDEMSAYWDTYNNDLSGTICYYLKNSPIFGCADWEDYDACRIIHKVKAYLDAPQSNYAKVKSIIKTLKQANYL